MRLLPTLFVFICIMTGFLHGQQRTWPEVEKFGNSITNLTWDLRGTNALKHLLFDGDNFRTVTPTGQPAGAYKDYAFVDVGVFQIVFSESRSAWYFVSDDLKLITPTNVIAEIEFKAEAGTAVKPVKNFPQDIQNVVWVGGDEQTQFKLRWNGSDLEVGIKTKAWEVHKARPIIANRRVFEFVDGKDLIWVAFSADGEEAWWLILTDVFGGHARSNPGTVALGVNATGLTPQLNDLANHAEDLLKAGDRLRSATLLRELERKNAKKPEALKQLKERFAALK